MLPLAGEYDFADRAQKLTRRVRWGASAEVSIWALLELLAPASWNSVIAAISLPSLFEFGITAELGHRGADEGVIHCSVIGPGKQ